MYVAGALYEGKIHPCMDIDTVPLWLPSEGAEHYHGLQKWAKELDMKHCRNEFLLRSMCRHRKGNFDQIGHTGVACGAFGRVWASGAAFSFAHWIASPIGNDLLFVIWASAA